MKFRMILSVLLLPTIAAAQQSVVKPPSVQPYRVVAIQEPVAAAEMAPSAQEPVTPPKTAPPADVSPYLSYLLPADSQIVSATTLFDTQGQSKVRVDLNLRNAPLKEAIKQLTGQTKQMFVLDDDVPADARVTAVAKNIRLSTALDLITDATGLNWSRQMPLGKPQTNQKADAKSAEIVIHIGKNVSRNSLLWSTISPGNFQNGNKLYQWDLTNKNFNLLKQELLNKESILQKPGKNPYFQEPLKWAPATRLNLIIPSPEARKGSANLSFPNPADLSVTYAPLGSTLLGATTLNEVRSTFTCPHCKRQVTVIHQHQSPKCEKCGRVFHNDWDFCPFDGAKRPANASSDWQFCPLCGKSVKSDGKEDAKPGN